MSLNCCLLYVGKQRRCLLLGSPIEYINLYIYLDLDLDLFGDIYRLQWCRVIKKLQLTILYIIDS